MKRMNGSMDGCKSRMGIDKLITYRVWSVCMNLLLRMMMIYQMIKMRVYEVTGGLVGG